MLWKRQPRSQGLFPENEVVENCQVWMSVFFISVPVAPSQVSVTSIMETSLQVSWRQTDPLDLILQYMVQVKSEVGDWEKVNDTIQGSSVLVKNLSAFTGYSFRVRAKNGLGTSPYSQPSPNVTTLEGGMRRDFYRNYI